MAKCKRCGKEIDHVMVDFFDREGYDRPVSCTFDEYPDEHAIELDVDHEWTGYELDFQTDECRDTIRCPFCDKFPFDDEIHVHDIVRVIMFTGIKEGDNRNASSDMDHSGV